MTAASRRVVIAGNWKMYKTLEESLAFLQEITPLVENAKASIYLAVPFTSIKSLADQAKESNIVIGAQNINDASEGAFTGEIAGKMLKDAGAKFVLVGHSERRRFFHETDELINKKIKRAFSDDLEVILCIGETKEERENNETEKVLTEQLEIALKDVELANKSLIIAYEPVWAIGAIVPATPEVAESSQKFCRSILTKLYGEEVANSTVIQYGGAIKANNSEEFLKEPDIDGLLVGGASLSVEEFAKIVNSYQG